MPSVYDHEMASYRCEIDNLRSECEQHGAVAKQTSSTFNVTHFHLRISNRSNMLLVGMCSLLEARLTEIALERQNASDLSLEETKGQGLPKVVKFLKNNDCFDFGRFKYWSRFTHLYVVRNSIVHGYGGIVPAKDTEKLKKSLAALNMQNCFVGQQRIRVSTDALYEAHATVTGFFAEIPSG